MWWRREEDGEQKASCLALSVDGLGNCLSCKGMCWLQLWVRESEAHFCEERQGYPCRALSSVHMWPSVHFSTFPIRQWASWAYNLFVIILLSPAPSTVPSAWLMLSRCLSKDINQEKSSPARTVERGTTHNSWGHPGSKVQVFHHGWLCGRFTLF